MMNVREQDEKEIMICKAIQTNFLFINIFIQKHALTMTDWTFTII